MESTINTLRGYGKLDHPHRPSSARVRLALFLSLALLLLLAAATAVLALKSRREPSASPPLPSASLRSVCSLTLHPALCLSSLSASNSTDPSDLLALSLRASADALRAAADLPRHLSAGANGSRAAEALGTCTDQIQDALDQLDASLGLLAAALTESKVADLRTYLSAVLTDIETCLDGFEGTTGGFREKVDAALERPKELESNSLAIATHILSLLGAVHRKLLMMEPL